MDRSNGIENNMRFWSKKYGRLITAEEAIVISRNIIELLEVVLKFNLTKKGGKDGLEKE